MLFRKPLLNLRKDCFKYFEKEANISVRLSEETRSRDAAESSSASLTPSRSRPRSNYGSKIFFPPSQWRVKYISSSSASLTPSRSRPRSN